MRILLNTSIGIFLLTVFSLQIKACANFYVDRFGRFFLKLDIKQSRLRKMFLLHRGLLTLLLRSLFNDGKVYWKRFYRDYLINSFNIKFFLGKV